MRASERYELLEELGHGGMGVVYRARDRTLGREVAIKMLRRKGEANPRLPARMLREARAIAKLEHPNIVRIHDVLDDGLVMEFVRGRPLDLGALPLAERLKALEDVARAVHAAHERRVIHRDLKPGNVLREETGRVVVTDFGIALLADARSRLTQTGYVVGTPHYMAPEQMQGERIDGRADVYSLGVMLYEALAGRAPFTAPTVGELRRKVLTEDPPPLEGIPRDLATICRRALEKDPRDRYRTARALAEDLTNHRAGRRIATRPSAMWTRLVRRKRRVWVTGVIGLLAIFAAATAVKLRGMQEGIIDVQRARLEEMRRTSGTCLEAALDLRRVGKLDRMGEYASKVYAICDRVIEELPGSAEPHYLRGRMHRALMKDEEALQEQDRALAKEPGYAPALYERLILVTRLYHRRVTELREEERRREGRRLAEGGGGEVRPGSSLKLRFERELVEADSRAQGLMRRMEEDSERLKTGAEALTGGQRACAEGLRALVADHCEEVRSILKGAMEKEPCLEEAYEGLALHEERHGKYDEAIRWWTVAIERDRGYIPYFCKRGMARLNWGLYKAGCGEDPGALYDAAFEDFAEALRLDPRWHETLTARGVARMGWSLYKSAHGEGSDPLYEAPISDFDEALKLNPGRDVTWRMRGIARLNWGLYKAGCGEDPGALYDAALDDFAEALRLDPRRRETWDGRGMARMGWGLYKSVHGDDPGPLYEAAIGDFSEALKLDPGRDDTWLGRGLARLNWSLHKVTCGEDPCASYKEAFEDFSEAVRLNPGWDETWMRRGVTRADWAWCKSRHGEDPGPLYEAAIRDFDEALKLNPARGGTWVGRGVVRENWGLYKADRGEDPSALYEAAIGDHGEAIRLVPVQYEAWSARGGARVNWSVHKSMRGEDPGALLDAAIEDLRRALEINRSDATTWQYLGGAFFCRGRNLARRREPASACYRSALEAYEQALRLNRLFEAELRPVIDECRRRVE